MLKMFSTLKLQALTLLDIVFCAIYRRFPFLPALSYHGATIRRINTSSLLQLLRRKILVFYHGPSATYIIDEPIYFFFRFQVRHARCALADFFFAC